MPEKTETYKAKAVCFNCNKVVSINVDVGKEVYDEKCPICRTRNLLPMY